MSVTLTRRALLTGALSAVATATFADAPARSLRPRERARDLGLSRIRPQARTSLQDILENSGLGGDMSVAIANMRSGQMLESHQGDVFLPPASVTKSVTALYALDALGANYRFSTRILATGPIRDGIIQGDLILAGGGDPVLTTDHLADLAAALKSAGILGVTGGFKVYGNALPYEEEIDPGQLDHLGYNPALSGLNLNFNRVHFEWARAGGSYRVSMDARTELYRPDVTIARMRVADRSRPIYAYESAENTDNWSVARGALGDRGSRWLPVRKPALYAGDVFRTLARAQGVTLPQAQRMTQTPSGTELALHNSAPLQDILRDMLKYSTNLTAEIIGLAASKRRSGTVPTDLQGSAQQMTQWINQTFGVNASFVDHSGLGDLTRINADQMIKILTSEGSFDALHPILKHIALRDAEGNVLRDHPADVRAKTGTLNFVSALAGYVQVSGGDHLAFAIISGDLAQREIGKASPDEMPQGARTYNTRAKRLQQRLLQRWGQIYAPAQVVAQVAVTD